LKMSDNIDLGFLDSLIQELCKRLDLFETADSRNFFKLIFTNVPRNIIQALKKRNCRSFLMLKETFCLMLDEADEPHFLGAPRASNNIFDVEDALALIFHASSIPREKLASRGDLGLSSHAVDQVQKLLGTNEDSIFFCHNVNEKPTFECYDILGALKEARRQSFSALQDFRIYETDGGILKAAFKLRNGTYVDCIYDFCLFWSDENRLVDCTKLLLAQAGFPLVDTLVAFMNNGDRLAAGIQRYTKTPNLIIVDPHRPDSWEGQEIDGNFILVLDAVYPGDHNGGYIKDFIDRLGAINSDANIKQILALCDFRRETFRPSYSRRPLQGTSDSLLAGKEVVSVPLPEELLIPRSITPDADLNIVQNFQTYILSKPSQSSADRGRRDDADLSWKSHQYSPIELSTEFWQNVSAVGVIDSKRTGREDRNVLFYENNERLIQNSRMRRIVTEFVADYIKNVLDLKVDVILHPTHPVGSFLAQLVSKQLNNTPLVLPLTQRKYGGQIELTSDDYDFFQKRIDEVRSERSRSSLTSLIVDDSVLSGNSLFTMLGVAARLGLSTNGVLVLLSRLSPEISNTLSLLSVNFAYLYRLHMPILTNNQSPDTKLRELNEKILRTSNSYFGQLWGNILKNVLDEEKNGSHFRPSGEEINQDLPPRVAPEYLNNIRAEHIDTHILRQVIQNLLLHPDPHILTFYTRVGISYNFLEQLVHEEDFWDLLMGLFEAAEAPKHRSQSVLLVRKILYILAFSKHIFPFTVYRRFQEICCVFIKRCFDEGLWVELKDFVTDCIMWLGVAGSEKITEAGKVILLSTLGYSFGNFSISKGTGDLPYEGSLRDVTPEQRKAAMEILGAYARSLHVYLSQKGQNILDNNSANDLVEAIIKRYPSIEGNLVLIDMLEPIMALSSQLREKTGIETWETEEEFIKPLSPTSHEPGLINYLKDAPGYTCTLKTVLRICKADTVLLYVKNRSDKEYFLRVFDTRQNKRADDDLKAEHLRQSYLHEDIKERMDEDLFFSSSRPDHTQAINYFSKSSRHLWCMGAPVNVRGSEMSYYVILGYWQRGPKHVLQSTAYYYWLKCEALLRDILPQIHSKYVESATEWNAHIQSIRPFHPIASNDKGRTEMVNARREVVSLSMTKIDIGDLLRRAVRMSSEPVYKLEAIRDQIVQVCKNLRVFVKSILDNKRNTDLAQNSLLNRRNLPIHGPQMNALTASQQTTFCALHIAVLEFIAYESLFNAIAYHDKDISVRISFDDEPDSFPHIITPVDLIGITLTVTNDIHPKAVSDSLPVKPIGRVACETAASAVNGSFSADYNDDKTRWVATLVLPAYRVPDELRRQLHELLG
jgi:orotate phosphoribosyltransferase